MGRLVLIGTIIIWGALHSWLASLEAQAFVGRALGMKIMQVYRLAYNLFSLISFLPILFLMRAIEDQSLYVVPPPWRQVMLAGQVLSIFLLVVVVFKTDMFAFTGLRQLVETDKQAGVLFTDGFYHFVRHPFYLFGLLVLWLTSAMTINLLIVYLSLTVYVFVGIYFEERKLLCLFGPKYAEYRSHTPMIIPGLVSKRIK